VSKIMKATAADASALHGAEEGFSNVVNPLAVEAKLCCLM
jgi:hypothetical protein